MIRLFIKNWVLLSIVLIFMLAVLLFSCRSSSSKISLNERYYQPIEKKYDTAGIPFIIRFTVGKFHNHPTFVLWTEDTSGNYLETIFITRSIATGTFNYGYADSGKWHSGPVRRPAALPYWSHKRGVLAPDGLYLPTPENPMPDAITAATPKADFQINFALDRNYPAKFKVMLEVNQTWDWNEYYTNNKYPDDVEYKTSCQPSLIYEAIIDLNSVKDKVIFIPRGHGHYSGKDGSLTADLSSMTTAMHIFDEVSVFFTKNDGAF